MPINFVVDLMALYLYYKLNHLVVGLLGRHQFKRIYREAVVAKSRYYSGFSLETEENYENLSAVDIQSEIRTAHLSDISLELNRYTNLVGNTL
jgi:hypothetical protein